MLDKINLKLKFYFGLISLILFSSFLFSQDDIGEDFEDIVFVYHGYIGI